MLLADLHLKFVWCNIYKPYSKFGRKRVKYDNNLPEQALLISSAKSGDDFVYYNGAAWDRAGKITNGAAWNKAVEEYKNKLKKPLKVVLK